MHRATLSLRAPSHASTSASISMGPPRGSPCRYLAPMYPSASGTPPTVSCPATPCPRMPRPPAPRPPAPCPHAPCSPVPCPAIPCPPCTLHPYILHPCILPRCCVAPLHPAPLYPASCTQDCLLASKLYPALPVGTEVTVSSLLMLTPLAHQSSARGPLLEASVMTPRIPTLRLPLSP